MSCSGALFNWRVAKKTAAVHVGKRSVPDQLSRKGRRKGPVPSQQLDEDCADDHIQPGIQRREAAFSKQGHANDLDRVRHDGDEPGFALLR